MEIKKIGKGSPIIGIVGSLHGNELIGKKIIEKLNDYSFPGVTLKTIIANTDAIKQHVRFIEIDGNRCFPGNKKGKLEERLAHNLIKELNECDYVLDIHSTYANQPDTVIITKKNILKHTLNIPIKKVLLMGPKIAKGHALIDYVKNGMSIEFSRRRKFSDTFNILLVTIKNISLGKKTYSPKEVYLVMDVFGKRNDKIKAQNFQKINKKEFAKFDHSKSAFLKDAFPLFIGEKGYSAFCMVAKKLS